MDEVSHGSQQKGSTYSFCTVSNCDISVAGGGIQEVKRHCKSVKHRTLLEGLEDQPSLTTTLSKASAEYSFRHHKVLKSEICFARFIAEHNLSFATADHFTKFCKCMFPDSKIVEAFSCTCIYKDCCSCDSCTWSRCRVLLQKCVKNNHSQFCVMAVTITSIRSILECWYNCRMSISVKLLSAF